MQLKKTAKIPNLSITIPAFNEEETISSVIKNALASLNKLHTHYELLLIDDGSRDETGKIMERFKRNYHEKIRVIHHKKNKGFSGAMKSCFDNARGELIFLGPADGQFEYSQVNFFLDEIKNKDFVVAYRVINEEKFYRKINSQLFHFLCRILFNIRFKEFSSCILYTKKVRDSIRIDSHPFSCLFLIELIYKSLKLNYKFGQVPIKFEKRKGGIAKGSNPRMILRTLIEMFKFWLDIHTGKVNIRRSE